VFKSIQGPQARSRIYAAAALAVAAVSLSACAASGGAPAAAPAQTVTQTAQASPAPAASNPTAPAAPASTAAAVAATAAAPSGDTLPEYKPSTLLSGGSDTTVVLSPDSVDKVAAFYENALKSGGWQWHATAKSRWSAHFEATKDSAHAVIQISSTGKGVSIAVTIIK
jgi:uncharacterized glyoxalase superfamily protein PhnB